MDQGKDLPGQMVASSDGINEVARLSVEKIAERFKVPRHLLIEPGHVMSEKTYRRLLVAQQKQK